MQVNEHERLSTPPTIIEILLRVALNTITLGAFIAALSQ
jgi:hypothetical protein